MSKTKYVALYNNSEIPYARGARGEYIYIFEDTLTEKAIVEEIGLFKLGLQVDVRLLADFGLKRGDTLEVYITNSTTTTLMLALKVAHVCHVLGIKLVYNYYDKEKDRLTEQIMY